MLRRTLLLRGLLLSLLLWVNVRPALGAAAPLTLSQLQIELWPEFDRPAVLVIVTGTLAPEVALPAAVTWRLPKASGGPHAVTVQNAQGALVEAAYATANDGDALVVQFQSNSAVFHLEYYDPALTIQGENRDYSFQAGPDLIAARVNVQVQEPVDSRALTANVALTPAPAGSLGLKYDIASLGALTADQPLSFQLHYLKSTATLSAQRVAEQRATQSVQATAEAQRAALPGPGAPPGDDFPWVWLPGVLIGLGVLVMGALAAVGLRRRATQAARASRPTLAACPRCGQRPAAEDVFCRGCGAPLAAGPAHPSAA